jgi:hypothetical protein
MRDKARRIRGEDHQAAAVAWKKLIDIGQLAGG